MAQLKITFGITPNQFQALQLLCEHNPESFSMPVNAGVATYFNFPIEDLPTVHEYLRLAGNGRAVNLGQYDLSDEVLELDWAWSTQKDHLVFRYVNIETATGIACISQKFMAFGECAETLQLAGMPTFGGDEEFYLNEFMDAKYILLAAFLISNPSYLTDSDELPELGAVGELLKLLPQREMALAA